MKELFNRISKFIKSVIGLIKTYISPIVILGLCIIGIFNLHPFFGYEVTSRIAFIAIAFMYAFFHIDGFWNWLKAASSGLWNKIFN